MVRRVASSAAALCAAVLVLAFAAQAAQAGEVVFAPQHPEAPTANDGWQAGTCYTKTCTAESDPSEFFEKTASHPVYGFTQFIIKHHPFEVGGITFAGTEEPEVDMKDIRVDLPVGLSVNPGATPQCELAPGAHPNPEGCPASTQVGESIVTVSPEAVGSPITLPPAPVYSLRPKPGQPARFGFSVNNPVVTEPPSDVFLEGDVAWEGDFHEGFTIAAPKNMGVRLLKNRLVFEGERHEPDGEGFFLTTPSTCWDPTAAAFMHTYSTWARADSYQNPDPEFPNGSPYVESPLPPGTSPKSCDTIPFDPQLGANPGTNLVDSPAGLETEVRMAIDPDPEGQEESTVRTAEVKLPLGMGLNPSAATGLQACSDPQFKKNVRSYGSGCPAASKIGTATIETPPLPEEPLSGNIYVGEPKSTDPESGREYRILVDAESQRYGVAVRLVGEVHANRQTGQITAVFDDPPKFDALRGELPHGLPQAPFTRFSLDLDDGARAALTSPPTCSAAKVGGVLTPWSAEFSAKKTATPSSAFTPSAMPGGGACPKTLAERPFAPGFGAVTTNPKGGGFTNFDVTLTRRDGNQEIKGVTVSMPPGLTAKLAGVSYCPEANIAAAAASSGVAERAAPSCPASSLIGNVAVASGSGPSPTQIAGKAFLAGPYAGAPLSLVTITPATTGPFDLGSVVVRVALHVDPETAQIQAVSEAIPHIFGGALLDVRSIAVDIDRKDFSLNPTNCSPMAVGATIRGGGGDPANPAAFSAVPAAAPFQVSGCDALGFKPKLFLRTFGGTRRTKHPRLRAVLIARPGDANIGRASVALPHALILDQANVANVCTRPQFAADACPRRSRYGYARAFTPLLDHPLEGPVYLRSSSNPLPDMVAKLKGQVEVDLVGRIDTFHGGIRTTFDRVPDVPVSKFMLTLPGGKHGLLVNSRNLCPKPKRKHHHAGRHRAGAKQRKGGKRHHRRGRRIRVIARFRAQNGKKANLHPKLRTPCGKHKHKHRRRGHRH
jgi:hypothetical protein